MLKSAMPQKLLLFDIDGTLLLAGGAGKVALEQAFQELFGIPECWGNLDPHGRTDASIFDEIAGRCLGRLLTRVEFDRLMRRYETLFEDRIMTAACYELMPGVTRLLEYLSKEPGIFLALATGNFEGAGRMKLKRGKIEHYFKAGGFGMDSRERHKILLAAVEHAESVSGKSFSKTDIYVIGDTEYDVAAAKKAGLKSIAVLTNGRTGSDFKNDPPDHILKDLTDISGFMECLR